MTKSSEELIALQAIYPEELVIDGYTSHHARMDIPLALEKPMLFQVTQGQSFENTYLPSLHLELVIPPEYPSNAPPKAQLTADTPWLFLEFLQELEKEAAAVWELHDHEPMLISYMTHIQDRIASTARSGLLNISPTMAEKLKDSDRSMRQTQFEKRTFKCEICLELEKGSLCHSMACCNTVFCIACLREFYDACIKEDRIEEVKCLSHECEPADSDWLLDPGTLLEVGLKPVTVQIYAYRKRHMALEADGSTVWCPRSWCYGAAKSSRHPKTIICDTGQVTYDIDDSTAGLSYSGLPEANDSREAVPEDDTRPNCRLAICSDCTFAFCTLCLRSWHGEYNPCSPPPTAKELEETNRIANNASVQYIHDRGTRCPGCRTPYFRSSGCDHMKCKRCGTKFCYRCGRELSNDHGVCNHVDGGKCVKKVGLVMKTVDEGRGEVWALQEN